MNVENGRWGALSLDRWFGSYTPPTVSHYPLASVGDRTGEGEGGY